MTVAMAKRSADGGDVCACVDLVDLFVGDVDDGGSGCASVLAGPWVAAARLDWLAGRGLGSRGSFGRGSIRAVRRVSVGL